MVSPAGPGSIGGGIGGTPDTTLGAVSSEGPADCSGAATITAAVAAGFAALFATRLAAFFATRLAAFVAIRLAAFFAGRLAAFFAGRLAAFFAALFGAFLRAFFDAMPVSLAPFVPPIPAEKIKIRRSAKKRRGRLWLSRGGRPIGVNGRPPPRPGAGGLQLRRDAKKRGLVAEMGL
jgi:hypothetical protein